MWKTLASGETKAKEKVGLCGEGKRKEEKRAVGGFGPARKGVEYCWTASTKVNLWSGAVVVRNRRGWLGEGRRARERMIEFAFCDAARGGGSASVETKAEAGCRIRTALLSRRTMCESEEYAMEVTVWKLAAAAWPSVSAWMPLPASSAGEGRGGVVEVARASV